MKLLIADHQSGTVPNRKVISKKRCSTITIVYNSLYSYIKFISVVFTNLLLKKQFADDTCIFINDNSLVRGSSKSL